MSGETGNECLRVLYFFNPLYYKMTVGIFNERVFTLVENVYKAIKEEVDLVKENKTNNPDSKHKGSIIRALTNTLHSHLQTTSRIYAKKGLLGDTDCNSCYWIWNIGTKTCSTCPCEGGC